MILVYTDTRGDSYGFCSRVCLSFWRHYTEAPLAQPALHQPPDAEPESSVGCWWCGTDLMSQEGIRWIEEKRAG